MINMMSLKNNYIENSLEYLTCTVCADLGKLSTELVRLTITGTVDEIEYFEEFIDYLKDMGFLRNEADLFYKSYLKALRANLEQQLITAFEKVYN